VKVFCFLIAIVFFLSSCLLHLHYSSISELISVASRTALMPTQPPIQWVPGALSLAVKRPGREADHSPPSSAEIKEWVELYLHPPNMPSWCGAQFKHRDNFTFTFTIWTDGRTQHNKNQVKGHYCKRPHNEFSEIWHNGTTRPVAHWPDV
jgi:hypothetical protein